MGDPFGNAETSASSSYVNFPHADHNGNLTAGTSAAVPNVDMAHPSMQLHPQQLPDISYNFHDDTEIQPNKYPFDNLEEPEDYDTEDEYSAAEPLDDYLSEDEGTHSDTHEDLTANGDDGDLDLDDGDEDLEGQMEFNMRQNFKDALAHFKDERNPEALMQESMNDFADDMRRVTGVGKRKGKGRGGQRFPAEVESIVGEANRAYIDEQYGLAIEKWQEIIRIAPNMSKAWKNLAMIHAHLGNEYQALQLYLCHAQMTNTDSAAWKNLARVSIDQNRIPEAIYCFSRAIKKNRNDVDSLARQAHLYADRGDLDLAIEGFTRVLRLTPDDMENVKSLVEIHMKLKEYDRAILIFEDAIKRVKVPATNEDDVAKSHLDALSNINILAELYMGAFKYAEAITAITLGVRRLQNRSQEKWWDGFCDDREYLEEGTVEPAHGEARGRPPGGNDLPIDLRVKLGTCRLMTGQEEVGEIHYSYLWEFDVFEYADLYTDVAETRSEIGLFEDAIKIYQKLLDQCPEINQIEVWSQMAWCHRGAGNLDSAAEIYQRVIRESSDSVDAVISMKTLLAEVYEEMGQLNQALTLVTEAQSFRDLQKSEQELLMMSADGDIDMSEVRSIIQPEIRKLDVKRLQERAARARREKELEKDGHLKLVFEKWKSTVTSARRTKSFDETRKKEFYALGKILFEDFENAKLFFSYKKAGQPDIRRKARFTGTIDEQMEALVVRLNSRLEGEIFDEGKIHSTVAADHYRGSDFDDWFDLYVRTATVAAQDGKFEEANTILSKASECSAFVQVELRKIIIRVFQIAINLIAGNFEAVSESCRWLIPFRPLDPTSYRFLAMALSSGMDATHIFGSSNTLKAVLRQLKLIDFFALRDQPLPTRDAEDLENVEARTFGHLVIPISLMEQRDKIGKIPALLMLYGHLVTAAMTYTAAIGLYYRAYLSLPEDPLVNFCLGITYLNRSMQRQVDNRHRMIAQSFTFLFRYFEFRKGDQVEDTNNFFVQEAHYNIGRAFHQIGLEHLAVPYYQKVLEITSASRRAKNTQCGESHDYNLDDNDDDDDTDLSYEAAYNLAQIYISSGSMGLAQDLMIDYCTI